MKTHIIFLCLDIILILFLATALWINDGIFLMLVTYFTCIFQIVEIVRIQKKKKE